MSGCEILLAAMGQANVEIVRAAYESFQATGQFAEQFVTPDFVWDMSKFRGWPEQQLYEGADGARRFLADWLDAWEDWELEIDQLHDAGERSSQSSASAAARRHRAYRSTCALRRSGRCRAANRHASRCTQIQTKRWRRSGFSSRRIARQQRL